jgi:hypothetical protein
MIYGGNDPMHCADTQTQITTQGLLIKYDAAGILLTASVTDTPIGYTIDEGSRAGAGHALEAAGTQVCSILPLDGVCYLKAEALASGGKFGMPIYVSQTADTDGYVDTDSSNSATLVGYYFGNDASWALGDLIPVSIA